MAGILTPPSSTSSPQDDQLERGIPTSHRWARRGAVFGAGVILFMLAAWVGTDPVENLSTDWTAFDNTADRVLSGEEVYRPYNGTTEPLPYLYPPYALWLTLPLGAVGFAGSFVLSALLSFVCLATGLIWMGRSQLGRVDRTTGVIVGLASGSAISSTLIGQYSGIYALAIGGAAQAWSRDRHGVAGAFLAMLWLKPNLAIAVPVVLLWSRSWRALQGFVLTTALIMLASLPFGLHQWNGFFSNAKMMADLQEDGVVPFRKMVTLVGSVQTLLPVDSTDPALIIFWLGSTAILGVAVLSLWTRPALLESPTRALGALALFIVAANPRLYFYDSTLVVVGMFGIWLAAHGSAASNSGQAVRVVSALAVLGWFGLWGGVFVSVNTIVGPVSAFAIVTTAVFQRFSPVPEGQPAPANGPSGL